MLTIFEPRCEKFFFYLSIWVPPVSILATASSIYRENGLDFFAKVAPILLYFIFQAQLQRKVNLP